MWYVSFKNKIKFVMYQYNSCNPVGKYIFCSVCNLGL